MYKITFKLRTAATSKKTGEAPVSILYRYDSTEFVKATGVSCKPQDFDTKKGRVKGSDLQARDKNKLISEVLGDIEGAAKACSLTDRIPTASNVQAQMKAHADLISAFDERRALNSDQRAELEEREEQAEEFRFQQDLEKAQAWVARAEQELDDARSWLKILTGENTVEVKNLFTTRIDDLLNRKSPRPKPATIKGYESLKQLVAGYNPRLDIRKVSLTTLNEFQNWLIEVKHLKNQSINNYTTKFKAVLKEFADELDMNLAWLHKFKAVSDVANENIVVLTDSELADIESIDLSKWKVMSEVREQFLLCVETGLRHSDLDKIRPTSVEDMERGDGQLLSYKQLRIATEKKQKQIIVPLTPTALKILERNNYHFPIYHLRNYNQAIESIARRCPTLQGEFIRTHYSGHKRTEEVLRKAEFVTSHAARKTFINNALLKGVSESTVARWVGHADVKMIQKYYSQRDRQAAAEAHKIL
jgi:integrase